MTLPHSNPDTDSRPDPFRWSRHDTAQALHDFQQSQRPPQSRRQFAQQAGIPHASFDYWVRRQQQPDSEPELAAFLHSPAGQRFLRRLLLAVHLACHQAGTCGLRDLTRFLVLAQLDRFVAASYGAQQALAAHLRDEVIAYGDQQRQRLAPGMAPKAIAACLDENFHGDQDCLVAIEPASNFLLLEAYRDNRDAETWTAALRQALGGMPVEIIQVTSDQAKGLIACARDGLDAHHSPDLFHGQQDLTRATALPLHRQTEAAAAEVAAADAHADQQRQRQEAYERGPRPPGRSPDWAVAGDLAHGRQRQAATRLAACQQRQEQTREAIRGLGDDYHPFDPCSGAPLEAAAVEERLQRRLAAVEEIVTQARLGERGREAVAKARRWLVPVVATIAWFWEAVRGRVAALELSAAAEQAVYEQLLPGLYWEKAAERGRDAEQRGRLRKLSERLLSRGRSSRGPLGRLSAAERAAVERVASEAAGLFVRSSSCVEGRNGRLSLYHHGQGPLGEKRLRALTVLHNYWAERPDRTTAAERFFGAKPQPLFEWLLERMPDLPRPVKKASKASPGPELAGDAA